jgi:NAD(P)-dependent dehydrogenase (short-subunit alcohol dehydrogenase family)
MLAEGRTSDGRSDTEETRMKDAAGRGRLAGRHVVITGAGSGIGRATAQMFAAEGARLALLDRDELGLAETAKLSGGHMFTVDVTNEQDVARVIGAAHATMGALDGVVNSAGIMCADKLANTTLATWQRVIDVNLTGPFLVCRAAQPFLAQRPGASIVNIASAQALLPGLTGGVYAASKAGVMVFTKSLAAELAPGIRANVICPGAATTPMGNAAVDAMDAQTRAAFIGRYAIGRLSRPEEVAAAILFLMSDEASSITGIALAVDGGRTFH